MKRAELAVLGAALLAGLVVSFIGSYDPRVWALEVLPIFLGLPALWLTRQRVPWSPFVLRLVFLHALILMLGAHYTYARVPLGEWARELFGFSRNHYDRVGHFAQGFIPAILVREALLARTPLRPGGWLGFLSLSVCLAMSAVYEFTEWWTALLTGTVGTEFLGTQGDVWDTQWDMLMCTLGALASLALLSRAHDRALGQSRSASAR